MKGWFNIPHHQTAPVFITEKTLTLSLAVCWNAGLSLGGYLHKTLTVGMKELESKQLEEQNKSGPNHCLLKSSGNPSDPWANLDQTKKYLKPFGLQPKIWWLETYFPLKEPHNSLSL